MGREKKLPGRVTWDGVVISVARKYFWAKLQDRADKGVDESYCPFMEEARIPIAEVKPKDRELLREGALFRMTANSKRVVINFLRFRKWTKKEIAEASARAEEMSAALGVE